MDTIQIDDNTRLKVEYDEDAECPRGDWHMLTGFVSLPHRGDSCRMDVPAVYDDDYRLWEAWSTQSNWRTEEEFVIRYARIFHNLVVEYDSAHGGFWFCAGIEHTVHNLDVSHGMFAANWPELVVGSPEHFAKQAEVVAGERKVYEQWVCGEVYGITLERRAEAVTKYTRADETYWQEESVYWEPVESLWGIFLDYTYTAEVAARENWGDLTTYSA
jgi:hypothetical protein